MEKKNSIAEIARRNRSIPITEPSNRGRVLIHAHRTVAKEEGGGGRGNERSYFQDFCQIRSFFVRSPFHREARTGENWSTRCRIKMQ